MKSLTLTIFGITSNLSQIKLIPALYDMEEKGLLSQNLNLLGNARTPMSKSAFSEYINKVLHSTNIHHQHPIQPSVVKKLLDKFHYIDGHLDDPSFYIKLNEFLGKFDSSEKIFY